MAWLKVDDQLADHWKWLELHDDPALWARAQALWLSAACYCARHLTDGFVRRGVLYRLTPLDRDEAEAAAAALVRVELWEEEPDGYRFHDWGDYQPSAAAIREKRRRDRERKRGNPSERNRRGVHAENSRTPRTPVRIPSGSRPDPNPEENSHVSDRDGVGVQGERWRSEPDPRCAGPRLGSRPVSLAGRSRSGQDDEVSAAELAHDLALAPSSAAEADEQLDEDLGAGRRAAGLQAADADAVDDEAPPAAELVHDLALARSSAAEGDEQLDEDLGAGRRAAGLQGADADAADDEAPPAAELARRAVKLLNELTGRSFRAGETVRGYVRDLRRRGVGWEQLDAVIRVKHAEWSGDARMARQLKPSVLLRPKNYLRYLEEDVGTGAAPRPLAPRSAWELVEAEISRVGAYGKATLPPDVEAACRAVGWRNLCMAREGQAERLFLDAYRSASRLASSAT